ncbi:MAG: S-layer homology domain-containing protein [Oscillospiraceae bacterium]|nr:S-layer homology domain-containing protein [Oscillospiraceae bacterium]
MKRLLSLILVIAMTAAMLPSITFAAEADAGVTIEYYTYAGTNSGGFSDASKIDYARYNGRIEYLATTSTAKYPYSWDQTAKNTMGEPIYRFIAAFVLTAGSDEYMAYKIRVPEKGEYKASLYYLACTNSDAARGGSLYILPPGSETDIAGALKSATPVLSDVNFYSETNQFKTTEEVSFTAEKSGEYLMVWKNTGDTGSRITPVKLTLNGGSGKAPIWGFPECEDKTVFVGDETTVKGTIYMSDGSVATAEEKKAIEYISQNTSVATVSGDTVKAVGVGKATIQAKYGELLIGEAEIEVEARVYDAVESATLSFRADEIPAGCSDIAILSLISEKGEEYFDPYTVSFEALPTSVAEIDEKTGRIYAKNPGEVTITAHITDTKQNNIKAEKTLKVTEASDTERQPVTIDFNAVTRDSSFGESVSGKTVYPVWAFSGEKIKVVEEKTTTFKTHLNVKNEGLSSLDGVTRPKNLLLLNTEGTPWKEGVGREGRITFKIKMNTTEPGWYSVSLSGGKWTAGGVWNVFFGDEYAGIFSSRDIDYPGNSPWTDFEAEKLGTVYIEPDSEGWAEMSFLLADPGYGSTGGVNDKSLRSESARLLLSKLTLTPEVWWKTEEKIGVIAPESIIIGEKASLKAFLADSEDSPVVYGEYDVNREENSRDSFRFEVVSGDSVEIREENAYVNGALIGNTYNARISAKKLGNTVLRFSAKKNGVEYTRDVTVSVVEYPILDKVNLTLAKRAVPATRRTSASFELFRVGDGKEYTEDYTIRYESTNPKVATVDEKTGEIEALEEGETVIRLTVTDYKGNEVSAEQPLAVTEKPVLNSLSVKGSQILLPGETSKLSVEAVMTDGVVTSADAYEISFESSDEEIITITDDGEITVQKIGSAAIIVTAINEKGEKKLTVFPVDVVAETSDIVVDFVQTEEADGRGVPSVTPGYTILTEEGNANYFRKFYCEDSKKLQVFQIGTPSNGNKPWPENGDTSGTFALSVNADGAGYYSMSVTGGVWYAGSDYSVFVNSSYAGDVSFHQKDESNTKLFSGEEQKLNTVYLQKGENKIYFRFKKKYEGSAPYLVLNNITLKAVKGDVAFKELLMSEIPKQLAVGEIFEDTVSVGLSDGSVLSLGPSATGEEPDERNTISAKLIGDACIDMTGFEYELCKADKRSYKLVAKKPGEAKLVFSLTIDGKTESFEYPITVLEDELIGADARCEASELYAGDSSKLIAKAIFKSGRESENSQSAVAEFESLTPEIATVANGMLVTHCEGIAKIKVSLSFHNVVTGEGKTVEGIAEIPVEAQGMSGIEATAGGSKIIRLTEKGREDTVPLYAEAISNLGEKMDMTGAVVSAKALTPEYAEISGLDILPVSEGNAQFEVTVTTNDGRTRSQIITLRVAYGKDKATYYTAEKALAARENAEKYSWARSTIESYVKRADGYIENLDKIYDLIPSEGIPRTITLGEADDPSSYNCKYCNTDLMVEYGSIPWVHNPTNRPWKIQCPDCKRVFPTNDFESFYKLGLNEYGEFDRMRALKAHRELFGDKSVTEPGKENSAQWKKYYGYGVKGGYLTNELYSDLSVSKTINCGQGLRDGETEATWGVDDSLGYVPSMSDGTPYTVNSGTTIATERHGYIAEYVHFGLWRRESEGYAGALIRNVVMDSAYAYFYTGDIKYGRVAAVLLDRIADFYPYYEVKPWIGRFRLNDGGSGCGGIMGNIVESQEMVRYISAYDMVYDVYDDPFVVNFIANKGKTLKYRHAKETPSQIRTNIEDGIIRTVLQGLRDHSINGNFGLPQKTNAVAAVVLDSMPETSEWLDYLMAAGWHRDPAKEVTGGGINEVLVNTIDADGQGNEGSQYNIAWHTNLLSVQEVLDAYEKAGEANLYTHPKFIQMFYSNIPLIATYYTPAIGDSGTTQGSGLWVQQNVMQEGWKNIGDPIFAQLLYKLNGNSAKGLKYGISERNPERLEDEVEAVIREYGEFRPKSEMMTNFGFSIIRDGNEFVSTSEANSKDTRRDLWMYFGNNTGHAHLDTLNLGMSAFGLELLPDLGYPEMADRSANRLQWVTGTISHNTVQVDNREQFHGIEERGDSKHFDVSETVSLMDVSTPYIYPYSVEEYRRSVVMIKVNDEISYAVDFFRVLGGYEHVYSFHAASNTMPFTEGLGELVPQMKNGEYAGTLAGIDVPYGADPGTISGTLEYPKGYTWIDTIDYAENPENKFEIDFNIKDFNKNIKDSSGIRLRMTMHNEENVAKGADVDVKIGNGYPPNKKENKNIDKLKYVIVKNTGNALDTVFTTVLEPYRNERYLTSSEELNMTVVSGIEKDGAAHRALKVTHESGRVDYIFYATDNSVTYKITDEIAGEPEDITFRGFIGVYTVNSEGVNIYSYVHDGDTIGKETDSLSAVTGVLKSVTKELSVNNELVIIPQEELSGEILADLPGRYVFVDNGAEVRSGAWRIEDAYMRGEDLVLDVGRVTAIRQYVDMYEPEKGYVYTVTPGQSVRIPLSYSEDFAPVFESVSDSLSASVGSLVSFTVNAVSELGETVIYSEETLPRGASLDVTTGKITWTPGSSQVGKNHFAITASDESGRSTTIHFYITVYGSTSGGGSGATAPTTPDKEDTTGKTEKPVGEDAPVLPPEDAETVRFTDLASHAWAADAINALADKGIVKGTSATTYSPANNITRADFAILLVRAFEKESDNTENFADVSESDYFAAELAIARNTGLVGGIGDNKFAPRENIKRCDMMLMVYRVLNTIDASLVQREEDRHTAVEGLPSSQYADFEDVPDYAKEAVSALIGAGLVNGKNNLIAPLDNTTRAEVAVLIKRVLDYKSSLS